MKNLIFLPLLLISCLCFAQDGKEVIGKPFKIGNLLISELGFGKAMNWADAKLACHALGNGWRLPTKNELNILHKNRKKIGFPYASVWSSTVYEGSFVWVLDSVDGRQYRTKKSEECCVRPVKSL